MRFDRKFSKKVFVGRGGQLMVLVTMARVSNHWLAYGFGVSVTMEWVGYSADERKQSQNCSNLQKMAHPWAKKCVNLEPNYHWGHAAPDAACKERGNGIY
jgi:hypothetical protein